MAKVIDLRRVKANTLEDLQSVRERIEGAEVQGLHYLLIRWMCAMSAVEAHAIWERYVEKRLTTALNHKPNHFLKAHEILGVKRISSALAAYIVKGGNKYFDFRSMSDLLGKADKWLSKSDNTFRKIATDDQKYIDALAAVRNCVVHGSEAALSSYKHHLRVAYGVSAAPKPDEFLKAKDLRASSPQRYEPRLFGLIAVLERAVRIT